MPKEQNSRYSPVDAAPVKSFFVHMLTRDIRLEDAILDLLDNSVDGILRSKVSRSRRGSSRPYSGYAAEIEFKRDYFLISDNCGGIPWSLHEYAFRMGRMEERPQDAPGSVGTYGIGMKRAIFKMGRRCLISTQNGKDAYDVDITPRWTEDENEWKIPVAPSKKPQDQDGTTIYIGDLYDGISSRFGEDGKTFKVDLERLIATHYALIIEKGLTVKLNGDPVKSRFTRLVFDTRANPKRNALVRPYLFKATINGVEVFLAVGFTRPIPSQDEMLDQQEENKYSSLDAGWTIICNGRAVLYCDRTELTGWGEAGVPRYHNQFIAISGVVEFSADDARDLPTTTTKRGVDTSSTLFLQVKNRMREGMRIFTDYTNKWKAHTEDSKKQIEAGSRLEIEELKELSHNLEFRKTKGSYPEGEIFKPELPMPKKLDPGVRRISFVRPTEDVENVSEYLFQDRDTSPAVVGERCFELQLKQARK